MPRPGESTTDLKGKVALVTGGGTGIGGAVARRFINRGAQVLVADGGQSIVDLGMLPLSGA
jgi:NAD(P)-dependent dehydrogenase (short-subunit alcohol dehydrogenase family)